jgi:predicted DCC family thiol-disulfide oxidoreductase YuxK
MNSPKDKPIIIYDGECALCQHAVRFLKNTDGSPGFNFISSSTLQSDDLLQANRLPKDLAEKSMILIDNDRVFTKSTAVIKALQRKGRDQNFNDTSIHWYDW